MVVVMLPVPVRFLLGFALVVGWLGSGRAGAAGAHKTSHVLTNPWGIAVDRAGSVYVTDNTAHHVIRLSPRGKVLKIWGSRGQLGDPRGLAIDSHGNVYVADLDKDLHVFSPSGRALEDWPAAKGAEDVAFDRHGNAYVSDGLNDRIKKLSASGRPLATWSTLPTPSYLAVDAAGDIYVTFEGSNHIEKLSPAGKRLATWTAPRWNGSDAQLSGIAADVLGHIWVVDLMLSRVLQFSSQGKLLRSWDDAYADATDPGKFASPTDIALDVHDNVYVTDTLNQRVQKLSLQRKVLAIWR
jgi:tripartite motif-containing protein 71